MKFPFIIVRQGCFKGVMKILLLTRYGQIGASSRYRMHQFLPALSNFDIEVSCFPLLDDNYLESRYANQTYPSSKVLFTYLKRIAHLFTLGKYDLLWIQNELFPYLPAWVELLISLKIPYVVDYDDAIFHRYDQHSSPLVRYMLGNKIDLVMRHASLVIAGNHYLANHAELAGAKRVEILPTVIDLEKYSPVVESDNSIFTIGWIGSPSTTKYLENIQQSLKQICQEGGAQVTTIGAANLSLDGVPITAKPWHSDTELHDLCQFDVGIMPLTETPWERGKCGFKLIQYMACGIPTVGSPVGINKEIIQHGKTGFQALSSEDWVKYLLRLKSDKILRQRLGQAGRRIVKSTYSLQAILPRLVNLLYSAV